MKSEGQEEVSLQLRFLLLIQQFDMRLLNSSLQEISKYDYSFGMEIFHIHFYMYLLPCERVTNCILIAWFFLFAGRWDCPQALSMRKLPCWNPYLVKMILLLCWIFSSLRVSIKTRWLSATFTTVWIASGLCDLIKFILPVVTPM